MAGETFELKFNNNSENYRVTIDEPINFATVDFQLSQKDKGYGRDVSFNGGETQFEFVKYRNHYLDKLLLYNTTYGFESIVELIITCGTVTTIIGELDFATAVTDDLEYFKCKVIQQSSKQIVKRRKSVKVDLLSDKDVDGNTTTPLVPQNTLLISKPIYQVSKWEQPKDIVYYYNAPTGGDYGYGANFAKQIIQSDIEDSLVPNDYESIGLLGNYNNLQCITAATNLKNVKISIPAFYFKITLDGVTGNPGSISYRFSYGVGNPLSSYPNQPVLTDLKSSGVINTQGGSYSYNEAFEITIPNITAGDSLFVFHRIYINKVLNDNQLIRAIVNCNGMKMNISAESDTYNSIAPSFRLVDVMRQVVKSISGLSITAPRFDVGGDFYNNRLFNGNSLRAISDKPFYVSLEDLEKSLIELNVDWEINADGNIFFGTEDDFYTESIAYTFTNTQFSSFNKSFNPRFSINEFNYGYKNFQSLKENDEPNSADVIHGESKWVLGNKMVENKKDISIEWTRDAFLIETNRRKSLEITSDTSSQNDDTLFAIDTLNTTSNVTYSEKIILLHSYNSTDAILTLTNTGELNFLTIGIINGSSFSIISPTIHNIGVYKVFLATNKTLQLKLISGLTPSGYVDAFLTYFDYILEQSTIPYTNYTDSGFTGITNLIASDKYSNLRYSIRRNIDKYWKKYIATCNLYHKTQGLSSTWYKNNTDFSSTYSGLTLTEKEVIDTYAVNPILTPFLYNDVIFSNVEFSDFITLQDNIRTNRGYILTKDNSGNDLKLYPTTMKYDNLSKELNIKGEEKYTPTALVQITPVLTTKVITDISPYIASSGGYIKTNGGSAITAKGIVWDVNTNPTTALLTKTTDGSGSVDYKSSLTGLLPLKSYYVKSYATNTVGTSYGNQIQFTTTDDFLIGFQTWKVLNLDVTTYRNGDAIPEVNDPTAWASLTTGAWCWYDSSSSNGAVYGKLYNWYAVNDARGLAPLGYHIPTLTEFQTLTTYLGGTTVAGGKMKSTGNTTIGDGLWLSPNVGATNESSFLGLPAGVKNESGISNLLNRYGYFWTSTSATTSTANSLRLFYNDDDSTYATIFKTNGCSVRLIKD